MDGRVRPSERRRLAAMPTRPTPLTCEECGREQAADERGWRSLLTVDSAEEPEKAIVYCPRCAEREFARRRSSERHGATSDPRVLSFWPCYPRSLMWVPV
jgi:hypothetical protein